MSWKLSTGRLYPVVKHNWKLVGEGDVFSALRCGKGDEREDATCRGCDLLVHGLEIQANFGDVSGGFVTADIIDAIAAGVYFDSNEVASVGH